MPHDPLTLPLDGLEPDETYAPPTRTERIFVNRSLRLDRIEAVGFDMDYTLAVYRQAAMDQASIEATLPKLRTLGYDERLLEGPFQTEMGVRGLLVDKKLGNVLKMDRYRYVKRAYHGTRELPVTERRALYHQKRISAGERFHFVDTLYALCEIALYAGMIDVADRHAIPVDTTRLWDDIRRCVDASHQDGSILDRIVLDPAAFVERDPALPSMLHKLRSAGKRLFLLTNSQPAYTEVMMRYLLGEPGPGRAGWRRSFDAVVTAARKPSFFEGDEPFSEWVDGKLVPATSLERGRMYVGGNLRDFERLFGAQGEAVLYVGDHIYGDVLRAKKEGAFRTMMIVEEMHHELAIVDRTAHLAARLERLERERERLVDEQRRLLHQAKKVQRALDGDAETDARRADLEADRARLRKALDVCKGRLDTLEADYRRRERSLEDAFHPMWGSIFRAGTEVSSFGDQVEEFACLYTTRASNLRHYSAAHYFHSPRERMPHEV